jgi:tight adherence protein C
MELLVAILVAVAVLCVGGAILVARAERSTRVAHRMALGSVAVSGGDDRREQVLSTLDRIGQMVSSGKTSRTLKEELASAGFYSPGASAAFLGAKTLLIFAGIIVAALMAMAFHLQPRSGIILGVMLCAILFFLPNMVVDSRRKARRDEIRRHLPDAIDLLEISISAGMGLDQAWNAVTGELHSVSTILADEMALTNLEMHLGAPRALAMRHLADRTKADELASLVAVMVQSERFGTSMSDAMRTFASSMREQRSHKAQEEAETMAVKLIFPMIIFLFPAVVLVTAGPAGISLVHALHTSTTSK